MTLDQSSEHVGSRNADLLARTISDVANPLVVPSLLMVILSLLVPLPFSESVLGTSVALSFYTLFPLMAALWMLKKGMIESLDIPVHKERTLLFSIGILSTTLGSLLLLMLFLDPAHIFFQAAVVFLINPPVALLLNRSFKISIHVGTVATAGTFLLGMCLFGLGSPNFWTLIFSLIFLLILLPAVAWARYRLRVHSIPELAGGAAAGIALTLLETGLMQLLG